MSAYKRPSFRSLTRSFVTVKIGPSQQEFVVHKELLCHYCGYFKGAVSGKFREANEGLVTLDDVRPEVFELFVELLYTQKLDWGIYAIFDNISWEDLTQLYVFSDARSVAPKLKNTIMDCIVVKLKRDGPQLLEHQINFVYENTNENSKLRSLLVEFWIFEEGCASVEGRPDSWNETFLRDLVCRWKKRYLREPADPDSANPEKPRYEYPDGVCGSFHEHGEQDNSCFYDEATDTFELRVEIS
ncbi:MAG: hypothetical protein M1835_005529 [Candelina submexicana]|nr:MAG: hypothetical protein M1835_005529 [Candelina submexicana]